MDVLYEDNHVIAVVKPAGVLVQGDASGDGTLQDDVKAWIAAKYAKPGNVYLGLVHRLDRSVGGVMVFARTSKAAARLSEQIRERQVDKIYRAIVEGTPSPSTLRHYMTDDDGYVKVFDQPGPGRKDARLSFRVLRGSLIEIDLETGRKHQIRAQLSHVGHPIRGDKRYGARTSWPNGIALVCYRMAFAHPTKNERVVVELPTGLAGEFQE